MKEQQIRRILYEIAERQVPDDVNLWPAIRTQVQPRRQPAFWGGLRPTTRLGWACLAVILFLTFGAVTYAVAPAVERLFHQEAGLQHIEQAGLLQEYDLSRTVDGVTVTLQRVYADANRVVVGLTVIGPEGQRYDPRRVTLTDANGVVFPLATGWGATGRSDIPGFDIDVLPGQGVYVMGFDTTIEEGAPAALSLRLVVEVERFALPLGAISPFLTSARPPAEPTGAAGAEVEVAPTPEEGAVVGPFTFDFDVAFNAGHTVEVQQVVESAGVSVKLERVVVTPSETRATLCFEPPAGSNTVWTLIAALDVGNGQSLFGGVVKPVNGGREEDCHCVIFPYALAGRSGLWTLTVSELVGTDLAKRPSEDVRLAGPWVFRFRLP